ISYRCICYCAVHSFPTRRSSDLVVPYIQSHGIVMQGWYPFGGRGHTEELLNDETIVSIADAHNVTAAQVILRWNLQREVVVIPRSEEHTSELQSRFDLVCRLLLE